MTSFLCAISVGRRRSTAPRMAATPMIPPVAMMRTRPRSMTLRRRSRPGHHALWSLVPFPLLRGRFGCIIDLGGWRRLVRRGSLIRLRGLRHIGEVPQRCAIVRTDVLAVDWLTRGAILPANRAWNLPHSHPPRSRSTHSTPVRAVAPTSSSLIETTPSKWRTEATRVPETRHVPSTHASAVASSGPRPGALGMIPRHHHDNGADQPLTLTAPRPNDWTRPSHSRSPTTSHGAPFPHNQAPFRRMELSGFEPLTSWCDPGALPTEL